MRTKHKILCLAAIVVMLFTAIVFANEPNRPIVGTMLSQEKELKSSIIAVMSPAEVFESLKRIDFITDDDLMHRAIYKAFRYRKSKGIEIALDALTLPLHEIVDGQLVDRTDDHFVAKKILEVFPDKAARRLLEAYENADPITRGNLIRASGRIAGGKAMRKWLINALNDKTVCESEGPEMLGEPLRICDVAYSQLVFRNDIKNVLRVIGNGDRLENRDYHINILRKIL